MFFCLSQKSQLSCCDCYITMTCQWQGGSRALISQLVCSQFFLRQYSFFRSVFGAELQHMEQTVTCCCSLAWPLVEVSWGKILNLQSALNFCACVSGCNFLFFFYKSAWPLKIESAVFPPMSRWVFAWLISVTESRRETTESCHFFSCSTLLCFVKKMKIAAVWIPAIWWECTL